MAWANFIVRFKSKDSNSFTSILPDNFTRTANIDNDSTLLEMEFKNGFNHFTSASSGDTYFHAGDLIEVYVSNDVIDISTDNPLIIGSVKEFSYQTSEKSENIKLNLQDRTSILLNLRVATTIYKKTAPEIIKAIGDKVNYSADPDGNLLKEIDFSTGVDQVRPDDPSTQFPQRDLTLIWKTAYEWIKEVSQLEFLNTDAELENNDLVVTKPYFFYVNNDDPPKLIWHNRQDDLYDKTDDPIYYGQDGVYEFNLKKSVFGSYNMVIFNCGIDKNGSGTWWYEYDTNTKDSEIRISVQSFTDIADSYREELIVSDNKKTTLSGNLGVEDTSIGVTAGNIFNSGGGYAIISSQDEFIYYGGVTSNTLDNVVRAKFNTPASSHSLGVKIRVADTYGEMSNSDFRNECKARGKKRSQTLFSGLSGLRWKGTISLRGTTTYQVGDNIPIYKANQGLSGQKLRVTSITDTFDSKGWTTKLQLEEDPLESGNGGAT